MAVPVKVGVLAPPEAKRDAIHVAIVPVVAAERLGPGAAVRLQKGSTELVEAAVAHEALGIVDPFLWRQVEQGQRFWMFVMPDTVTNLRHDWSHPAFDGAISADDAEAWLREFAHEWNMDYREMIDGAVAGTYVVAHGAELTDSDLDQATHDAFWRCVSAVTGKTFTHEHRYGFCFSCSC